MYRIKEKINVQTMGRMLLVFFVGISLFSSGVSALADDDHGHRDGNDVQHRADVHRHANHYYRNGHWYRHGWFGLGVSVPILSAGVYVNSLPPTYAPVVVQGTTYYYGDSTYFSPSPDGGYTVVSPPSATN